MNSNTSRRINTINIQIVKIEGLKYIRENPLIE